MKIPPFPSLSRLAFCFAAGVSMLVPVAGALALDPPVLVSPGVNVSSSGSADSIFYFPSFSWTEVQGADSYEIEIAKNSAFTYGRIVATSRIERYVHGSPLLTGPVEQPFYWRVRSVSAGGVPSAWSEANRLTLVTPAKEQVILANFSLSDVRKTIADAVKDSTNGPTILRFAEGTYPLELWDNERLFDLNGVSNLIIDGGGSTIKLNNVRSAFSRLVNCENITIRNFKIDYDPYPNAWGVVTGTATGTDRRIKVRRDQFSVPFTSPWLRESTSILVLRSGTGPQRFWLKENYASLYTVDELDITEDATTREAIIPVSTVQVSDIKLDDLILFPFRLNALNETQKSKNVAYYQLTNYAAAGSSYKPLWSENVHFLQCSATVLDGRPFGGSADGVHAQGNINGPWVEGCLLSGLGDDAFAYYQRGLVITATNGSTLSVSDPSKILAVSDTLRIFNPRDGAITADHLRIVAITEPQNKVRTVTLDSPLTVSVETGTDSTVDQVFTINKNNGQFYIKNNVVDGDRGKALVMRCNDGVITGNTIKGASRAAMAFHNEPVWGNGLESWNILIENNIIDNCGWERMSHVNGMIMFENKDVDGVTTAPLHHDIRIVGNAINYWQERAISVSNVNRFTITDNILSSDTNTFLFPSPCGIEVKNSLNGTILGNDMIRDTRSYTPILVTSSTNVIQDVILDNASASGVTRQGTWNATSLSGCFGPGAVYRGAHSSSWVKYTPAILTSGTYEVFARWSANSNRATNVTIKIRDGGGVTTTKIVNQEINGGIWNSLGTYVLGTGTNGGHVMVSAEGANDYVVADAIQWVPRP